MWSDILVLLFLFLSKEISPSIITMLSVVKRKKGGESLRAWMNNIKTLAILIPKS
jgi:hypothetical protein